ncbi:nucleotidyltransferase domain-containing protein [Marinomonas gallaica]|uniref:nucleotidyltransferase domain-containing protein n=1 Tax=Marinomonas gallaica TaxID=1806667 RepID=UPI00082E1693|nr:nucleotidyltransferase domain-containing protein [Marinomonas gallaica]
MSEQFGLAPSDIELLRSVFECFPEVTQVLVYGSRVKGNFRASSDIDMTILDNVDWTLFNRIETELDDLMLPYQIDLSIFSHIENDALIDHIQRVGKPIYQATFP